MQVTQRNEGPKGADLMSDLVSKLRARRDGISGSFVGNSALDSQPDLQGHSNRRERGESGAAVASSSQLGIMSQVSSMIPVKAPSTSGSDEEEEDCDNEEWN